MDKTWVDIVKGDSNLLRYLSLIVVSVMNFPTQLRDSTSQIRTKKNSLIQRGTQSHLPGTSHRYHMPGNSVG